MATQQQEVARFFSTFYIHMLQISFKETGCRFNITNEEEAMGGGEPLWDDMKKACYYAVVDVLRSLWLQQQFVDTNLQYPGEIIHWSKDMTWV